jgi:hypothetical protein
MTCEELERMLRRYPGDVPTFLTIRDDREAPG